MSTAITLGPSLAGTLVARDRAAVVNAYCDAFAMRVGETGRIGREQARQWGAPNLADAPYAVLVSASGVPWLRVIEDRSLPAPAPLRHHGWMSLEIVVQAVDELAERLAHSPFTVLGPPRDLDVSDQIRAMQVAGPAGEVLYLTEIRAPVPPFELPIAACPVDRLFIPVLSAPDRDAASRFYEAFDGTRAFHFDTRITVVNRAFGYEAERRHPVSTLQLAGQSMIEIDQLPEATPRPCWRGFLPGGIALVSFEVADLDALPLRCGGQWRPQGLIYGGRRTAVATGAAGELIELIERA